MHFLRLLIQGLGLTITLIQTIRPLLELFKQRLDYLPAATTERQPITIDLVPISTRRENHMQEFQIDIEILFHKNQLFPRIRNEFRNCPDFNFETYMIEHGINPDFGFDLLVQMVLHKRAKLPVLVGTLLKHCNGNTQEIADTILKCVQADLVDWDPMTRTFIIRYDISADVQADLDRYQFPMPMVVEPEEIKTNRDTGYITHKGSVILKHNHHDEDVCLDHLNRINKTRFRLNMDVAHTVKNKWKNLDKPKPDEDISEYQKRVKQFDKYNRTAYDVMNHLGLATGGEFWLTHKYDKRGRTYCQGYHVNYQGAPWNKAVVEFANQEVIT